MLLRNHGTLAVGKNCADAFLRIYYLERACAMQTRALAGGAASNSQPGRARENRDAGQWAFNGWIGALAWPALCRKCDRMDPSYKNVTGTQPSWHRTSPSSGTEDIRFRHR